MTNDWIPRLAGMFVGIVAVIGIYGIFGSMKEAKPILPVVTKINVACAMLNTPTLNIEAAASESEVTDGVILLHGGGNIAAYKIMSGELCVVTELAQ